MIDRSPSPNLTQTGHHSSKAGATIRSDKNRTYLVRMFVRRRPAVTIRYNIAGASEKRKLCIRTVRRKKLIEKCFTYVVDVCSNFGTNAVHSLHWKFSRTKSAICRSALNSIATVIFRLPFILSRVSENKKQFYKRKNNLKIIKMPKALAEEPKIQKRLDF